MGQKRVEQFLVDLGPDVALESPSEPRSDDGPALVLHILISVLRASTETISATFTDRTSDGGRCTVIAVSVVTDRATRDSSVSLLTGFDR